MNAVVALSGGVDSLVAALLLKRDHNVIGVHFRLNDQPAPPIPQLGIEVHEIDLRNEFRGIKEDARAQSLRGLTPNPCQQCNQRIKFPALQAFAKRFNAVAATGHYARLDHGLIQRAVDLGKDQSFFLWNISTENLVFPLGSLTKDSVKQIALQHGFVPPRESQDRCFSLDLPDSQGPVVCGGKEIGTHRGIHRFTIGQRHMGKHVIGISGDRVILGEESDLEVSEILIGGIRVHRDPGKEILDFQGRGHGGLSRALVEISGDCARIRFFERIRRIAPGQSVVLFKDDRIVLGGIVVPDDTKGKAA